MSNWLSDYPFVLFVPAIGVFIFAWVMWGHHLRSRNPIEPDAGELGDFTPPTKGGSKPAHVDDSDFGMSHMHPLRKPPVRHDP